MADHSPAPHVDLETAADILMNLADMMQRYHLRDVALQNALSSMASDAISPPEMRELQHIDLLTQTHFDLSQLLPVLSACVRGVPTALADLRDALALRSLQDALIDKDCDEPGVEAGELSLF